MKTSPSPVSPTAALVALGSNLGDSVAVIRAVMKRLEMFSDHPVMASFLWRSTPVDCPPGSPLFVNAVVALVPRPGETPESLLERLQSLEKEFGRQPKKIRNESRPLDLDLIAFGTETRSNATLILPHPRAHQRRFVLQPLAEIVPDLILPTQTRPVAELLQALRTNEVLTRID